jgi:plastocyanin
MRHRLLVSVVVVPLAVLASIGERVAAERPARTVAIENLAFAPSTLRVKQGDTVVWRNADLFPHDVTADGGAFSSQSIAANGSWKYTAAKNGTFPYICTIHPTMKGVLIVE